MLLGRFTGAEADLYAGNYDASRATLLALQQPYHNAYGEKGKRYAFWLATLADLDRRAGKEAIASVLARHEQSPGIFSTIKSKTEEHAIAMQNYSTALASVKRLDESLAASGEAIVIFEALKNFDVGGLAVAYDRRAQWLQQMGSGEAAGAQYEKALTLISKSYGESGALYLNTLLSKARRLHGQGQRTEAWAMLCKLITTPRPPSSDSLGFHQQHYVLGVLLMNEGGLPVDPKAVEALVLETTRECKLTGSEIVGGMKMNVWTVKSTTPFDKSITTSRAWIGAEDGRVYRHSPAGLEQRIYYDNVIKPDVEQGRRRTRVSNG